jgi:L-seryl-tRNA(Ser) seleniumtransferase
MDEATNAGFVNFEELLRKTGEFIADTLGTELAFVTSGAAAAISLGSAAALAGDDRDKIGSIPDTSEFDRNEFVFQKGLDYTYKRCFTLSGAKLVEMGRDDGCTVEELEAGIGPKTAAIAYFESGRWGDEWVSLDQAREIADRHGIKLVVDAAGQMYPLERFTRVAQTGDVVAFGAKYFGSPHSTGICTGRADLVESAFQQNFLGFELAGLKGLKRPFGRPYKTDRGEVVGVAVALRRWFTMDHEERLGIEESKRSAISAGLSGIPGVEMVIPTEPLIGPNVVIQVFIDSDVTGKTTQQVIDELAAGDPPIWTRGDDRSINIGVQVLTDEQVQVVIDRLMASLS